MHYFKSLKISKTHSERSKERNCTQPKCRVKSFKHTTYISSILLNSLPINERVNTQLLTGGNWHSSKCGSQTDDPTNQEESRGGSEVCTHAPGAHVNTGQASLAWLFLSRCSLKLNAPVTEESSLSICVCHALSRCYGHSHWWKRKIPGTYIPEGGDARNIFLQTFALNFTVMIWLSRT